MAEKLFALSEDTKDKVLELIGRKPAPDKYANKTPVMREYYSRMWLVQLDEDLPGFTYSLSGTRMATGVDAWVLEKNSDDTIEQREWNNTQVKLKKQVYNPTENTLPATDDNDKPILYIAVQDMLGTIWIQPPAADTRDVFEVASTAATYPERYVKGNLFYVEWDSTNKKWVEIQNIMYGNKLAICQRDLPNDYSGGSFLMPYYTPEMNYGYPPNKSSVSSEQFTERCGVAYGEHVFSNKRLDYHYSNGRYSYEPIFTFTGTVTGTYLGEVKIEIEGAYYTVSFSGVFNQANPPHFLPDIYIGDTLTVRVDASGQYAPIVTAIDYPVDFQEGTLLLTNMYGANVYGNQWRGWEDVTDTYYGNMPANAVVCYMNNGALQLGTVAFGNDITLPEIWEMRNTLGLNLYEKQKVFTDGCIL